MASTAAFNELERAPVLKRALLPRWPSRYTLCVTSAATSHTYSTMRAAAGCAARHALVSPED